MSDAGLTPIAPQGYHDFVGLGKLRAQANQDGSAAFRKVAEQFETHFLQQMMQSMRAAVEKSDLVDSGSADMFQDMMDKEVATRMASRSSVGIADMLVRQWEQRQAGFVPMAPGAALPLAPARAALPLKDGAAAPMALPPAARKAYELDWAPADKRVKGAGHE